MLTYSQLTENLQILEESKSQNGHITHFEDVLFYGGVKGVKAAINRIVQLIKNPKNLKVSYKLDGCVHGDTLIATNKGDIPISDIVDNNNNIQKDLKVIGRNFEFEDLAFDSIGSLINVSKNNGDKNWIEIELEDGSKIKLTEDHEVHTRNRGWVEAGKLTEKDDLTEI